MTLQPPERLPSGTLFVPAVLRPADPALAAALDVELRREAARHQHWRDEHARHGSGGVGWSGPPMAPYVTPAPVQLVDRARAALARQAIVTASPEGRLTAALDEAARLSRTLPAAIEAARARRSTAAVQALAATARALAEASQGLIARAEALTARAAA